MKKHIRTSLYIKDEDKDWYKALKQYAKDNHWSVSLAIRELLSRYFEVNTISEKKPAPARTIENLSDIKIDKVDPDTYFAQIESKLAKTDNKQMAECIKEMTNDNGEINCYFFNNAREKHSFCKQYCWTNEKIWGKRVRP